MKGVSNLLALLIVVAIVIGVAIASSGIISSILVKMKPKGGDIVLTGFTWSWDEAEDRDSFIIYVKGVAVNVGKETVNVTDVWLSYGGREYYLSFKKLRLRPNGYYELYARGYVDELPESSPITVFVRYCSIRKCSVSFTRAQIQDTNYLIREEYYVVTVTQPVPVGGSSATVTITETVTSTATPTVTSTTITQTVTSTSTVTFTQTVTTTTTATTTVTKPAWPVEFSSCYGIDDYIYVWGSLDKKVNKDAEYIPYVLRVYDCTVIGCNLIGVVPFEWGSPFNPSSSSSIQAKYGPIQVKPLHSIKVEVWSIDVNTSSFRDKIWEETVNTSVRCA